MEVQRGLLLSTLLSRERLNKFAYILQFIIMHLLPVAQEAAVDPATFCPLRIMPDTIPLPAGMRPVDIPAWGLCSVSLTQKDHCQYPGYSTFACSMRKRQDLCEMPWAK
ncbi:MAG: hypothetical protein WC489_00375 [Patescibacteria group bacterium]